MMRRLATAISALTILATVAPTLQATPIFINELHYDNTGADTGEFVEIAGPAGSDLSGYSVVLYNGSTGVAYGTINLGGIIPDQQDGFGTLSFLQDPIQNGSPDGLALVGTGNTVIEFLSYEGTFTASGGPADGLHSTDIGVSEPSNTPIGHSLQRFGVGSDGADFIFAAPGPNTAGSINSGQTFQERQTVTPEPTAIAVWSLLLLVVLGAVVVRRRKRLAT